MNTLRSLWTWAAIVVLILVWTPLMAAVHLTDRDPARYRTGRWFRRLGSAITRANPSWTIRRTGRLPSNPRNPYVVVCNHQSNADTPVISRLPWDMKWVGKADLFKIPVVGWMMRWSRDIPVDRTSRISRARVLVHAEERLAARVSVMFFPEGTRSRDGRVGAFNEGAFRLAIRAGVPVLPLALDGTMECLPKKDWRFGHAEKIRLHVFDPISVEGLTDSDAPELRRRVHSLIVEQIASWRGVAPEQVAREQDQAVPS